jgi:metal-responsive CopG/Arc/MetJ family transcriptional regulator
MMRLNLTLDSDTSTRLERHAKRTGTRRATLARQLLREALVHREMEERRRKLATDYAAGRRDATALLEEHEAPQYEVMGDEEE